MTTPCPQQASRAPSTPSADLTALVNSFVEALKPQPGSQVSLVAASSWPVSSTHFRSRYVRLLWHVVSCGEMTAAKSIDWWHLHRWACAR